MIRRLLPPLVPRRDQLVVLWILATSIEHDRSPVAALLAFRHDCTPAACRQIDQLINALEAGTSLPDALDAASELVAPEIRLAARTGADAGSLATMLREAINRQRPRGNVEEAAPLSWLVYAVFVLTITTLIVGFVMYYIIPKFKKIFNDFGTELPAMTTRVVHLSDLVVNYFYMIPLFLGGCMLLVAWFRRRLPGRGIPALLESLSLATAAGRPLPGTVATLARFHPSGSIRRRLMAIRSQLEAAGSGWQAFREQGLLRSHEVASLDAAERAGNLPWTLQQLADARRNRNRNRWWMLWEWCRPALILLLGAITALMVIGLFVPLVKLTNDLS